MGKRIKVEPAPAFDPGSITEKALKTRRDVEKPLLLVPPQEAEMLRGIVAGKSAETACRDAGLDVGPTEARYRAGVVLSRYGDVLIHALQERGVTVDSIADGLAGLLHAEKPVVIGRGDDSCVEMYPDHGARQRAIDTVLDIFPGARAPKQTQSVHVTLEEVIHRIAKEEED